MNNKNLQQRKKWDYPYGFWPNFIKNTNTRKKEKLKRKKKHLDLRVLTTSNQKKIAINPPKKIRKKRKKKRKRKRKRAEITTNPECERAWIAKRAMKRLAKMKNVIKGIGWWWRRSGPLFSSSSSLLLLSVRKRFTLVFASFWKSSFESWEKTVL